MTKRFVVFQKVLILYTDDMIIASKSDSFLSWSSPYDDMLGDLASILLVRIEVIIVLIYHDYCLGFAIRKPDNIHDHSNMLASGISKCIVGLVIETSNHESLIRIGGITLHSDHEVL